MPRKSNESCIFSDPSISNYFLICIVFNYFAVKCLSSIEYVRKCLFATLHFENPFINAFANVIKEIWRSDYQTPIINLKNFEAYI